MGEDEQRARAAVEAAKLAVDRAVRLGRAAADVCGASPRLAELFGEAGELLEQGLEAALEARRW